MATIIITAMAICCAAFAVFTIFGKALSPVRTGENQKLYCVLTVNGDASELEQTVKGLLWLYESGKLGAHFIILDDGMSEQTRRVADLISKNDKRVDLYTATQFAKELGTEAVWI